MLDGILYNADNSDTIASIVVKLLLPFLQMRPSTIHGCNYLFRDATLPLHSIFNNLDIIKQYYNFTK
jgi:hypothetical protein